METAWQNIFSSGPYASTRFQPKLAPRFASEYLVRVEHDAIWMFCLKRPGSVFEKTTSGNGDEFFQKRLSAASARRNH